jgi:uncharacterized protein (TIGR02099 family)
VHRYLPLGVPEPARHYVRDAIVKGEARDVAVRIKGNLLDVPFEKNPAAGEFRFAGQAQGVTMAYVPRTIQPPEQTPWPLLEDLAGELIFDHNGMKVRNARARVQGHPGWAFTRIQAGIADFGHTRVIVDADGSGPLTAALGIARQSPVGQFTQHALDRATASGNAALKLALDLPIAHIHDAKVDGQVTLQDNDLRITPDTPQMTQAQGVVSFSDTSFTVQNVSARLLGGAARISGGMPPGAATPVLLRVAGTASAEGLRQMSDWAPLPAIARQASGSAAYEASIGLRAGAPDVMVTSDLRGMAFNLPAPLDKPADAAWPLRFESGRSANTAAGPERLRLTVADRLALDYELDTAATPTRVLRGAIDVGAAAAMTLPDTGVRARLQLPRLPVDGWVGATDRLTGNADLSASRTWLPTAWSLRADELLAGDRTLHDVQASGTRTGKVWRADVQAQELAGRIEYSEGTPGQPDQVGQVRARLTRLALPASTDEPAQEPAAALPANPPPTHLPALDIVADEFVLRGKPLGTLELQAASRPAAPRPGSISTQDWQLSRLQLTMPEASFSASGRWGAAPPPGVARRTQLDFRLDIQDAGALLTRLGMPDVLARGKGHLQGAIGWIGAPYLPHYPSMDGQLHIDVGAGQFLKADPGIAKLLGVLSLQALPRRLTLDFRDVFSTGFAFDFVRGDLAVQHGVASTRNLQMKGVNAAVLMEGHASIDDETQDLRVLVVPEIDASTAALAAAVINPAVGIGAFLAQAVLKRPLIKANTREFHVTGGWDDPQVTQVERPANAASAAPAPTESNPP